MDKTQFLFGGGFWISSGVTALRFVVPPSWDTTVPVEKSKPVQGGNQNEAKISWH